jgi:hypothetical protein
LQHEEAVGSTQLFLVVVIAFAVFVIVVSCAPLALTEAHELVPNRRHRRFHDDEPLSQRGLGVASS